MPLLLFNGRSLNTNSRTILSMDPDTYKFVYANGITDPMQMYAVNFLVTETKRIGIWDKMKAIYPFVGGTATTHKYNLKDARDLDAAYRLGFVGGLTHSSTGVLPDGSSGYANTYCVPTVALTENNTHVSVYSRTNNTTVGSEIQALMAGSNQMVIATRYSDGNLYTDQYNPTTNRIAYTNSDGRGFYISSRTSSTVFKAYKNGSQISSTNTNASSGFSTLTNAIGLWNSPPLQSNWSSKQLAFASIGDGLTDLEAANFYSVVQQYQTLLGRQV